MALNGHVEAGAAREDRPSTHGRAGATAVALLPFCYEPATVTIGAGGIRHVG